MKLISIEYNCTTATRKNSSFKKDTRELKNIVYFFYKDEECLYVGESSASLYERCFIHSPKEKKQKWFKEGNKIWIIQLDNQENELITTRCRRALEAMFIVINHPKYNLK